MQYSNPSKNQSPLDIASMQSSNSIDSRSYLDQKAELYALLKTANILKRQFDQGRLEPVSYFRNMQYFHSELTTLKQEFQTRNVGLLEITDGFPMDTNLQQMITFLASMDDYHFNNIAQQWEIDPYHLAAWTAEATSHFITLLDYLHLIEHLDGEFLEELFSNLIQSLNQVHMLRPFASRIYKLMQNLQILYPNENYIDNSLDPEKINSYLHDIGDKLYQIFIEFKKILSNQTAFSN